MSEIVTIVESPDAVTVLTVGVQGPVGITGAAGSVEYTGLGAPDAALGQAGDHYLNLATGDYHARGSSGWGSALGNLKGPQGLTGATGPAGLATAPGAIGAGFSNTIGIVTDIVVPYNCTIGSVQILLDQTGSAVIDIWKAGYAAFPPGAANSICASALPTVSSALKSLDATLTGWSRSLNAGDVLRFNLNSASGFNRGLLQLNVTRS